MRSVPSEQGLAGTSFRQLIGRRRQAGFPGSGAPWKLRWALGFGGRDERTKSCVWVGAGGRVLDGRVEDGLLQGVDSAYWEGGRGKNWRNSSPLAFSWRAGGGEFGSVLMGQEDR